MIQTEKDISEYVSETEKELTTAAVVTESPVTLSTAVEKAEPANIVITVLQETTETDSNAETVIPYEPLPEETGSEITAGETVSESEETTEQIPEPVITSVQDTEQVTEEITTTVTTAEPDPEPVKLTPDEAHMIAEEYLSEQGIHCVTDCFEVFEYEEYKAYRVEYADKTFMDHAYVPASTTGIGNRPESSALEAYDYEYRYEFTIDSYTGEVEYCNTAFTGEIPEGTDVKGNFYIEDSVPYTYYIYNGIGMPELSKVIDSWDEESSVISFRDLNGYESFIDKLRDAAKEIPKDKLGAGAMNFLYQDDLYDRFFFETKNLYLIRLSSENAFDYYNLDSVTADENGLGISITSIESSTLKEEINEQYLMIAVEKENLAGSVNAECTIDKRLDVNISEAEAKELSGTYGCSDAVGAMNMFDYTYEFTMDGIVTVYKSEFVWMPHFETAYKYSCTLNAVDGSLISLDVSEAMDDYTPPVREVYVPRVPYEKDEIKYTHGVTYSYYEYSDESIGILQNMIDLDTSEYNVKHEAGSNPKYKSILGFNDKAKFDGFVSELSSADLDGYTNSEAEAFLRDLQKYDEEYFAENNLYLISLEDEDPTVHYMYWMQVKFDNNGSFEPYLDLAAVGVDYGIRSGEKLNKLVLFEVSREEVKGTSNLEVFYIELKKYPDKENPEALDGTDRIDLCYIYHPKKYYYLTKDN